MKTRLSKEELEAQNKADTQAVRDKQFAEIGQTPKDKALVDYCRRVIQRVDDMLKKDHKPEAAVTLMSQHQSWIAQEQQAAFDHGATVEECAKWIAKNLNDKRLRQ